MIETHEHNRPTRNMEDKRLDNLMSYTTFHIGVYVTLTAALIGIGLWERSGTHPKLIRWLRYTVACLVVAGISGGVVGSNIPDFTDYTTFNSSKIGFWGIPMFPAWFWIHLEHLAFWAGLLPIAAMFVRHGPQFFNEQPKVA